MTMTNPKERFAASFILVVVVSIAVGSYFAGKATYAPYADLHGCATASRWWWDSDAEEAQKWHCTDHIESGQKGPSFLP